MFLLIGLGNPGSEYENTRHNAGWVAIEAIAGRYKFSPWRKKGKAELADGEVAGQKCLLIKPLTFMNISGEAVQPIVAFNKVPHSHIFVFYDELAIPTGTIKAKQGGGANGHNGIKSLDQHIGKDYWRVRLGIDHPGPERDVSDYVLGKFKKEEREATERLAENIARELPLLLEHKLSLFIERAGKKAPV